MGVGQGRNKLYSADCDGDLDAAFVGAYVAHYEEGAVGSGWLTTPPGGGGGGGRSSGRGE